MDYIHTNTQHIHTYTHNLLPTLQSTRFLEDRRQKSRNVDQGLLNTPAMTGSEWKEANNLLGHLYTRVTAHGLHQRICTIEDSTAPTKEPNAPIAEDCITL